MNYSSWRDRIRFLTWGGLSNCVVGWSHGESRRARYLGGGYGDPREELRGFSVCTEENVRPCLFVGNGDAWRISCITPLFDTTDPDGSVHLVGLLSRFQVRFTAKIQTHQLVDRNGAFFSHYSASSSFASLLRDTRPSTLL